MKIKEASRLCGVTEKAIRLYEEKGLIHPVITEVNGRAFRDYDEDAIKELQTVAGLRKVFFSMEQIARMQNDPETIPAEFSAYLDDLKTQYERLSALIARADAIDAGKITDAAMLHAVLTGSVDPKEDSGEKDDISLLFKESVRDNPPPPVDFHFHVWNEEIRGDAREAAYLRAQRYVERWGKRYDAELRTRRIVRRVLRILCVPAAILLILFFPISTKINKTYPAWEFGYSISENRFVPIRERSVTFQGWVTRSILGPRKFEGHITIPGFELYKRDIQRSGIHKITEQTKNNQSVIYFSQSDEHTRFFLFWLTYFYAEKIDDWGILFDYYPASYFNMLPLVFQAQWIPDAFPGADDLKSFASYHDSNFHKSMETSTFIAVGFDTQEDAVHAIEQYLSSIDPYMIRR